eukprot:760659-Hanusia_phi.AAC.2
MSSSDGAIHVEDAAAAGREADSTGLLTLVEEGGDLWQKLTSMESSECSDMPEAIMHSLAFGNAAIAKRLRQHIAGKVQETLTKMTSVWVAYLCKRGQPSDRSQSLPLMRNENKIVDALRILCTVEQNDIVVIDRRQQELSESAPVMLVKVLIQNGNEQVLLNKLSIAGEVLTARLGCKVQVWFEEPKVLSVSMFAESVPGQEERQEQPGHGHSDLRGVQILREGSIFVLQKPKQGGSGSSINWKSVYLVAEENNNHQLQLHMFSSSEECRKHYKKMADEISQTHRPILSINLRGACFAPWAPAASPVQVWRNISEKNLSDDADRCENTDSFCDWLLVFKHECSLQEYQFEEESGDVQISSSHRRQNFSDEAKRALQEVRILNEERSKPLALEPLSTSTKELVRLQENLKEIRGQGMGEGMLSLTRSNALSEAVTFQNVAVIREAEEEMGAEVNVNRVEKEDETREYSSLAKGVSNRLAYRNSFEEEEQEEEQEEQEQEQEKEEEEEEEEDERGKWQDKSPVREEKSNSPKPSVTTREMRSKAPGTSVLEPQRAGRGGRRGMRHSDSDLYRHEGRESEPRYAAILPQAEHTSTKFGSVWDTSGVGVKEVIPSRRSTAHFRSEKHVREALVEVNRYLFAASCLKPRRLWYMPTEEQLEQHGLTDLVHAIKVYHGGFASVARKLGMRIQVLVGEPLMARPDAVGAAGTCHSLEVLVYPVEFDRQAGGDCRYAAAAGGGVFLTHDSNSDHQAEARFPEIRIPPGRRS